MPWVFIYNEFMKNNFISILIKLACLLLISTSVSSDSDESAGDALDISLIAEYSSCADLYEINESEINNLTSILLLSGEAFFVEGDMVMSSTNAKAIVDSYDPISNKLTYYQTAKTGFKSFLIDEKITSTSSDTGVSSIKEFVNDFIVPCSELIVSIEEDPQQMIFIFADSAAAIKAKIKAQEMMAEIEAEMARQAALEVFQQKLADDKAAAAKSNAAYQSKLANDAQVAARMEELALEQELKAFEAKLAAELAAQEMMAEIEDEMARHADLLAQETVEREIAEFETELALEAFQQKLADEKAAAAASNAAYQDRLLEEEFAALESELASEAIEREIAVFEANLAKELADQAAQEMMAEIESEMARQAALEAFQQKLADEKAAAAAATAAYQAKVADEKAAAAELAAFKAELATHEECKATLNLSDSNIELFKTALADGNLFNVGPQITAGTEFTANRWDDYASCIGALGYKNPF